jgi:flagellar protein FlaG
MGKFAPFSVPILKIGFPRLAGLIPSMYTGRCLMGMQIAAAGAAGSPGVISRQDFPPDGGLSRRVKAADQERAAAIARFESSMPGGREPARKAEILAASSELERISLAFNRRLQFMVDHQSHDITVKVIDRETDKVIKVLPPEELQRMRDHIKETIGFLLDETI